MFVCLCVAHSGLQSKGFNYRRIQSYHTLDGAEKRDLTKLIGLNFVFLTTGFGKKFVSPVPALTQFGAGMAILAGATLVADLLVEYVLPHKRRYKTAKIHEIDDPGDFFSADPADETKPLLVQAD